MKSKKKDTIKKRVTSRLKGLGAIVLALFLTLTGLPFMPPVEAEAATGDEYWIIGYNNFRDPLFCTGQESSDESGNVYEVLSRINRWNNGYVTDDELGYVKLSNGSSLTSLGTLSNSGMEITISLEEATCVNAGCVHSYEGSGMLFQMKVDGTVKAETIGLGKEGKAKFLLDAGKYAVTYSSEPLEGNGIRYKYIVDFESVIDSLTVTPADATLTLGGSTKTLTVSPASAADKVEWSSEDTKIATVDSDGTVTPVSAGTVTIKATYKPEDGDPIVGTCKVTVNKAESTVAKIPTANNLTYNGKAQELVTAGEATGGTMQYALGTDEKTEPTTGWSDKVPSNTDAGTYYVWYKVVGDEDHLDTEAEPIEVKIDKGKGDTPEEANISLWSSDMACVDAVDGQEYVIVEKGGEPDWTKAVTGDEDGTVIFEGLQPYTEYDIYTRAKETENVYAGEAVSTAFLTDLAGFSVEGDTYVGETLTITTDPEDAEGLSYKWYYVNIVEEDEGYRQTELGDAIEGAEGATYTLTEDDYGKYVCVVIYRGDKEYDRSSEYGPVEYDPEKISYRNTEGAGGEWTKGSSDSLQMTFKRSVVDSETFSHFTGIRVDGKAVDASDYTAEAGSVIIKLNPSYLETLTVGEHVLTAQFDDADDAEADFTVKEAAESAKDADIKPSDTQADTQKTAEEKIDSPKTGDETNPQLMLLVMLLAAIDMALVAFIRSKKREN